MQSLLILAFAIAVVALVTHRRNQHPYPPGPPAHPIIGHLLKIPTEKQEEKFHEWAQKYGDIIHLRLPGRDLIVLDSDEVATELLDKRSAIYSSRPDFALFRQMGWLYTTTFLPYGKNWLNHRKLLQKYFGRKESQSYNPIQVNEAHTVIKSLLKNPENYDRIFQRFATALIVKITYGYQIESDDDPYVELSNKMDYSVNNAGPPGNTPVDFYPFLQYFPSWFPGTYYAKWAREWKPFTRDFHDKPYDDIRRQMNAGNVEPSFVASQLQEMDDAKITDPDSILQAKGVAGAIYGAGADTTRSTLVIFLFVMLQNPDVLRKAQQEIDSVVGPSRLPDFSDRENLPYVECVVQETLRWYPALHSGVPHRSVEDDVYKGMLIPKGSIVLPNSRGISLDEKVYRDPRKFYPQRYLPKPEGRGEPHCTGVFGYGRRICPGQFLAQNSVWIVAVCIMAMFDISKPIGSDGKAIVPSMDFSVGIVHHPKHFDCLIKPRSQKARELIEVA